MSASRGDTQSTRETSRCVLKLYAELYASRSGKDQETRYKVLGRCRRFFLSFLRLGRRDTRNLTAFMSIQRVEPFKARPIDVRFAWRYASTGEASLGGWSLRETGFNSGGLIVRTTRACMTNSSRARIALWITSVRGIYRDSSVVWRRPPEPLFSRGQRLL